MIQLISLCVWKRQREANNAACPVVMHKTRSANMTSPTCALTAVFNNHLPISMKRANKIQIWLSIFLNIFTTFVGGLLFHVSEQCSEKLVWEWYPGRKISYYTQQYPWDVITGPCPWYLLILAQHSWFLPVLYWRPMMTSSNGNIFSATGPFSRGIHWSPVNYPHKGQWRGALMFSVISA